MILYQNEIILVRHWYNTLWVMPGGGIKKHETPEQAAVREIKEELGIEIESSEELTVLEHDYPHAYVRLHVSVIRKWSGTPRGCEGQALSWELLGAKTPSVEPLLPAAWPMLERLKGLLP